MLAVILVSEFCVCECVYVCFFVCGGGGGVPGSGALTMCIFVGGITNSKKSEC